MAYKIAVASSDGKYVNQHFGRARQFLILEIDHNNYKFLELRQNKPACHSEGHTQDQLLNTVELLADCTSVLVSQIGRGAIEALASKGIKAYVLPDFIHEAVQKLISTIE